MLTDFLKLVIRGGGGGGGREEEEGGGGGDEGKPSTTTTTTTTSPPHHHHRFHLPHVKLHHQNSLKSRAKKLYSSSSSSSSTSSSSSSSSSRRRLDLSRSRSGRKKGGKEEGRGRNGGKEERRMWNRCGGVLIEETEDSLGAASHHSSRASLLEGRHQVVAERKKPIIVSVMKKEEKMKEEEEEEEEAAKPERKKKTKGRLKEEEEEDVKKKKEEEREKTKERKEKGNKEEKKIGKNKEEEEKKKEEDDAGKRKGKSRLRRKRGDAARLSFLSDTIIVGRDLDLIEDDGEDGSDHEPVVGAVRLSHQAALHKIAVRPRRTHGAPRARRATQIGITGQISLPDVIEEANSRHHISGQRSAPPQAAPTSPAPAPAAPITPPTASTPPTPDDDEVMEDAVVTREPQQQQGGGGEAAAERKEERRDEPLFQRLFGSSSKRSGRRQSRGSGEESRENSVSPLRRGTDQRAPRFPLLSSGSSKPRQEATPSHPLPPSGRPREASRERGVRELPQASHSPEEAPVTSGGPGVHRGQGVRKAKSFREEQTVVQREGLRRKVSPHAGAEGRSGAGPGKVARLSSSLENLDNDDMNRTTPPQATVAPAAPPTASPQRSSTESLATTPIPGVFIRPHPQTSRHRGPTHPSTPEHTSGPFSLDSSLPQQPREAEEHLRKASSVDQVSYEGLSHTTQSHTTLSHTTQSHREQVVKEQHILKDHIREQHIREQHKEQHIKEQVVVMKEQHLTREQQLHYKEEQTTTSRHLHQHHHTTTTTETKLTAGPTPPTPAAKQSLLDTLVESIRPDRKQDTPKHTHRKSLPQTHTSQIPPQPSPPQGFQKEEVSPAAPSDPKPDVGEGERDQAAPRRPVRREASMKRIPSIPNDANTTGVPEFMRIQLNRVESKGQSVIYDTDQERGDRRDSDVAPRRESIPSAPLTDLPKDMPPSDPPAETHTPLRRESVTPLPAASTRDSLTRRASMQGPRGVIRDTSPSAVADVGSGGGDTPSEPPSQESTVERVQLRRPGVAERTSHASSTSSSTSTASSTASTSRDQPELFKVFARRSFKIKDSEKELFEAASLEEVGVEASSEVSEMTVSAVRPPSTSPGPAVSPIPPAEPTPSAQKIGINAISFNRKSVGNPALSFIPPPTPAPSEPPAGPQGLGRPQAPPSTTTTTRSPSITTTTTTITTTETTTTAQQSGVFSKILSGRVSMGGEVSSGNESEGSTSSPVISRTPVPPQGKTASRPGSALFWPPKHQVAPQEDVTPSAAPPQVTPPQDITPRKAVDGVEEGVEVEVSPLDIGAARRRFMSASFPAAPTAALGTSPPAVTPSPVTPTPSPPAPTPSPPAPAQSHPPPTSTALGITSSILSRVGNTGLGMAPTHTPSPTPSPAPTHTPSFTVTVRTQPPPTLAPETPMPPASDGGKGGEPVQGQTSTEDWRVLVRQRREGRLKQTKTPDSEEIIIETRPPVSRNSKVLEMASNFQKLQVA
ncbi:serine/arginine repetitive matrix protein 2-like isoform X2 [Eriocheir sinensis]|uniref:serine/arginine repetitive matrix protein 2-like isoform X2 n=1 Tax=Eriocheir sinensis TaxID=95602 RepID=UPI0021C5DC61|nr:serine/arginine repetitive matrix protein 2-like isoform X2 [Eriocheir sinensis]